jgi:hypothetical protein
MPAGDGSGWSKPDTSLSRVTLDEAECASATRGAGATVDTGAGGLADVVRAGFENARRASAFAECMTAKGYRPRP